MPDMKFPEIFQHFDENAMRDGLVRFTCFTPDYKEYLFDYSLLKDEDKRNNELPSDTLTRLAKAIPECCDVLIDEQHMLREVDEHRNGEHILHFYTQAEYTEIPKDGWVPRLKLREN